MFLLVTPIISTFAHEKTKLICMETINDFFLLLSSLLWGWPTIVLLLGTHLFLTFRLRIPQRKLFTGIRLSIKKDDKAQGDVSQFGALSTALAATIGTGNIVGVATAVSLGGPGAVLWCWLTGIFGMSTKYAEALLAVKYRVQASDGHTYGGPMTRRDVSRHFPLKHKSVLLRRAHCIRLHVQDN